jgi:hypothetical protein
MLNPPEKGRRYKNIDPGTGQGARDRGIETGTDLVSNAPQLIAVKLDPSLFHLPVLRN